MNRRERKLNTVRCRDLVEEITDYLDGGLPDVRRDAIERHLDGCEDCARALEQWREVIRLTGRLGEGEVDGLDPSTRDDLVAAFRAQPPATD